MKKIIAVSLLALSLGWAAQASAGQGKIPAHQFQRIQIVLLPGKLGLEADVLDGVAERARQGNAGIVAHGAGNTRHGGIDKVHIRDHGHADIAANVQPLTGVCLGRPAERQGEKGNCDDLLHGSSF